MLKICTFNTQLSVLQLLNPNFIQEGEFINVQILWCLVCLYFLLVYIIIIHVSPVACFRNGIKYFLELSEIKEKIYQSDIVLYIRVQWLRSSWLL